LDTSTIDLSISQMSQSSTLSTSIFNGNVATETLKSEASRWRATIDEDGHYWFAVAL
jgi:hypothetical protein